MEITAKFASQCAGCGSRISVGQRVEWQRGSPARHAACAGSPSAPARHASGRRPSARHDHEDCLSLGSCGPDCEYAGIVGGAWRHA
jgi:hypothetical protein